MSVMTLQGLGVGSFATRPSALHHAHAGEAIVAVWEPKGRVLRNSALPTNPL